MSIDYQEWGWWYSCDGGERCSGPYQSREEAVEDAFEESYVGNPFEIYEARKGKICTAVFQDIDERFGEFKGEITDLQWRDLNARLNEAVAAWADVNDINSYVWRFAETRHHEIISNSRTAVAS
jgi:hypothetical protein